MLNNIAPHKFTQHLSRRPVVSTACFQESLPEIAFYTYPQPRIFSAHLISVSNGYTSV